MAGQNCINEGADRRGLGWLICPLQRLFSFKSTSPPCWLLKIRRNQVVRLGLAFPPYAIVQWGRPSDWGFFRIGWRYDTAYGYIFPTAALKRHLTNPLDQGY